MIPLHLRLSGIYSYQQEQSIDFGPLLEGQLFGIFGSVGSGKSTILEAMSFALYGETERLNARDSRGYNMMNLNSDELLVDFIFLAGKEQNKYRFLVEGRRNSKQFDKVNTFSRKAYKEENGDWVPLEVSNAADLTGLSYENFRRTIIIPQGKFSEFLQLGDKDRTQMMKEIFQLERFELHQPVRSLQSANNSAIADIESRLDQMGQVHPDELKALQEEIKTLDKARKETQAALSKQREAMQAFAERQNVWHAWQEQKRELQALQARQKEMAAREATLKNWLQAKEAFAPLLQEQQRIAKELHYNEQEHTALKEELQSLQRRLPEAEQKLEAAAKDYQQRDRLQQEARDLDRLITWRDNASKLAVLEARSAKGKTALSEQEKTLEALKTQRTEASKQLLEKEAKLPDANQLAGIRQWLFELATAKQEEQKLQEHITAQEAKAAASRDAMLAKVQKQWQETPPGSYEALGDWLKTQQERVHAATETLRQQEKEAAIHAGLLDYARQLSEGEPCPLCGAEHHPKPLSPEGGDSEATIQAALSAQQQKQEVLDTLKSDHQRCESSLEHIATDKEQQRQRLQEQKEKQEQLLAQPPLPEKSPSDLQALLDAASAESEALKALRTQVQELTEQEEAARETLDKYQKALQEFEQQKIALQSGQQTLIDQLEVLGVDVAEADSEKLKAKAESLRRRYEEAGKQHEAAQKLLNDLREQLSNVQGRESSLQKQAAELQKQAEATTKQVAATLQASQWATIDEVREVLKQSLDADKEREALEQFKARLQQLGETVAKASKDFEAQPFDPKQGHALHEQLQQLEATLEEQNEHFVRQQTEAERMQQVLEQSKAFAERLEKLQARAENLRTLEKLFRGSGFVNYVSGMMLDEVCAAANERFYPLTRQQLKLMVDEQNQFKVRDYLHEGKLRSVKTLSGGQTFQASLALALALSERIQQQVESPQNFFFLDEGFGSLDKDSLQTVFDTLKSLRKENRTVGIISHVGELQQEIDVYLQIVNTENKGSQIKASWEINPT